MTLTPIAEIPLSIPQFYTDRLKSFHNSWGGLLTLKRGALTRAFKSVLSESRGSRGCWVLGVGPERKL